MNAIEPRWYTDGRPVIIPTEDQDGAIVYARVQKTAQPNDILWARTLAAWPLHIRGGARN